MHPPIGFMFGPYENGVQYATVCLHNFLTETHANWSTAAREQLSRVPELNSAPQLPISNYLQEACLYEDTRQQLVRLGHYLPAFKSMGTYPSEAQIEALRLALPLHDVYLFEGIGFRLEELRYNLVQWAAITALYQLLLCTSYWQERGEIYADEAYSPYKLGLLHNDLIDANEIQDQINGFRRELKERKENRFAFHPLDVMARLFDPEYFERLLVLGLVELTPDKIARRYKF